MCGLVFAIGRTSVRQFVLAAHEVQKHRGPDDEGIVFEERDGIHLGFAHQRLSILDLSELGHQPMVSASGQTVLIFNGEIYNYQALAKEFDLRELVSGTDTEVALELIEKIGIEAACQRFNGMWALVVHDRTTNKIHLSRDRFGKKPLNYRLQDGTLYVASEVKSLFNIPNFIPRPNPAVAARFLSQSLQNVDTDTWVDGIEAFPAASIGEIDMRSPERGITAINRYWTPDLTEDTIRSEAEQIADLRETLEDATTIRLHADVPVGIALSGGLDSSTLAALAYHNGPSTTLLSVVHPGNKNDESSFINCLGDHLGGAVLKFSLNPADGDALCNEIRYCNHMNHGPIPSMSPLLFQSLMKLACENGIKVVITGQGADEVFCGYRKFPALEFCRMTRTGQLGVAVKFLIGYCKRGTWWPNFVFSESKRYLGASNSNLLGEATSAVVKKIALRNFKGTIADRQLLDIERYTVPYLCHYEDRMSMAQSVEVRSPFLDHRVVGIGLKMPTHFKMQSGWSKYALRLAFAEILPPQITWRKDKKGFVNPEGDWLRGPLKSRVMDIMGDPASPVYALGLVDRNAYLKAFDRYCKGSRRVWFRDILAPFSLALWLDTLPSQKIASDWTKT